MIKKDTIGSLTFNEKINIIKGKKIIHHWDKLIDSLPIERQNKIKENQLIHDPILSLKKICKSNNNVNSVKYGFSKNSKTYGRLFAKNPSLQNLPREFRGALAYGLYHDIDIKNAHPTFLNQYCLKKGIKCDYLDEYVNNRDEIISKLNSKFNNEIDIKNLILTVINGGDRTGITSQDEFLSNFTKEIKTIHNNIVLNNPDILKQVKRIYKNSDNINGKVVNLLLCNIENDTMLSAVEYLINNGFSVDVLVFDGFMILDNPAKPITDVLLKDVSNYVLNNTGYDLVFVEKPLDTSINDLLKNYEEDINQEEKPKPTYYNDKFEFEKKHFKILQPCLYATINEFDEIILQSKEQFIQSYEHITTTISGEDCKGQEKLDKVVFVKAWMRDENIRLYDKIDFYPNKNECPSNHYNFFKGLKVEKYEPINDTDKINKLIEPIIYHLKILAQEHYEFLLVFFAFIIQNPSKKTNVNIVVSGKDGTGKSIIFDFFRNMILGDEVSAQTDDADDIFDKFSNVYLNKLLLQIDEISCDDFKKKKAEKLKNITVAPKIKYEKKGSDPIRVNNYVNTVMTTNNDFTIPISQTDRRNVFFKCSDKHIQDHTYFTNLSSNFKKTEVARAFYEYLLDYDISSINSNWDEEAGLQNIRPITDYHKDIKKLCLPIIYRFWSCMCNYLFDNDDDNDDSYPNDKFIYIKSSSLYDIYCKWFDRCNFNINKCSITKFGMDINNMSCIDKKKKKDGNYYVIDKEILYEYLTSNNLYDDNAFI